MATTLWGRLFRSAGAGGGDESGNGGGAHTAVTRPRALADWCAPLPPPVALPLSSLLTAAPSETALPFVEARLCQKDTVTGFFAALVPALKIA